MGELGRRFQRHRVLRGFAEATKESYTGAMLGLFRAYGGTPPDQLTWIVYPKATAGNPEQALDYLGRYTHRVAISDHRIRAIADGGVTFSWRDRADGNAEKEMTLPLGDFIGRFLLHVLPKGFQKVRAFGWLAPRRTRGARAAIREALGTPPPPAGGGDRARTHPAAHPRGCHPLPGLRQGVPGLHPRTSPRPRRPRMNMPSPQKSTSRHDAHSGRCCGAMSASGGNASSGICALHPFMAKCLERAVFTHPLVVADGSGAAHAAKGNRRSAIQTP